MSSRAPTDEALMLEYERGSRTAFAELVRRHHVAVYNFMLRALGTALGADELAQGAFVSLIRDAGRLGDEAPFTTRLFSVAHRLVRERRAAAPERRVRAALELEPERGRARARSESLEESVVRAVDGLPDEQKDVFLLREVAALPFSQIALVTDQSETAVKVHMQQALERLGATLQDFEEYRRALR